MELMFKPLMTNFDNLYLKLHPQLLRYALKFLDDKSEALDLVQEIFVVLWEKDIFKDDEQKVIDYLYSATKNSCLNYLKHQVVVRKYEQAAAFYLRELEASHYQSGERSLIEKESILQIENAINSLSDIYKEVIILSRIEGLKNCKIAEQLNIPIRTVETRIFRALLLLKEKLRTNLPLFYFFLKKPYLS